MLRLGRVGVMWRFVCYRRHDVGVRGLKLPNRSRIIAAPGVVDKEARALVEETFDLVL
jgi:hypothetical protein